MFNKLFVNMLSEFVSKGNNILQFLAFGFGEEDKKFADIVFFDFHSVDFYGIVENDGGISHNFIVICQFHTDLGNSNLQ